MSPKLCLYQEVCQHYKTGDSKPNNHHVRATIPCKYWLAMDCGKIGELSVLQEFTTGDVMACNIEKRKRLRRATD